MKRNLKFTSPSIKKATTTTKVTSSRGRRSHRSARPSGTASTEVVRGGASCADEITFSNLNRWRIEARKLAFEGYIKRYLSMLQTNVIGQGIVVQSQVVDFDDKPDKPARKAIEQAWTNWQKKADSEGKLNFREICNTIIRTVAIEGEAFVRRRVKGKFGYQLELIEPQRIDVNHFEQLKNGNYIKFGIEFNGENEVVAYHVNNVIPSAIGLSSAHKERTRIPAEEIYHLYINEMVKQKRGLPWLASSSGRMRMLAGYEEAALTKARAGASTMGFFESETGDEYAGDETDDDGNIIRNMAPGTLEELPEGVKFKAFDPNYPTGEFAPFVKAGLRGVASSLSVNYNDIANDLEGVNFSSMRHGVINDREIWMTLQKWFEEKFIDLVFNDWLEQAYNFKLIKIFSKKGEPIALARPLEYYQPVKYQFRRWGWIQPLQEATAKEKEINLQIKTASAVIRENGGDPEEVFVERARELQRFKELEEEYGIEFTPKKESKPKPAKE